MKNFNNLHNTFPLIISQISTSYYFQVGKQGVHYATSDNNTPRTV